MTDAVISEQALRELIREALDDKDRFQVMADPFVSPTDQLPVPVNPSVDALGSCAGLDVSPIDAQFVPRDRVEFEVALRSLVKNMPDEVIPQLYMKVREIVVDEKDKNTVEPGEEQMGKIEPELGTEGLRKIIRGLIDEARMGLGGQTIHDDPFDDDDEGFDSLKAKDDFDDPGFAEPGAGGGADITRADDIGDDWEDDPFADDEEDTTSAWDPEPVDADDDEDNKAKKGKDRKRIGHGKGFADDGESFEDIAAKLGISVSGAKRLEREALIKLEYLQSLGETDLNKLLTRGLREFILKLQDKHDLSDEEAMSFFKHPDEVKKIAGWHESLAKTIADDMKRTGWAAEKEKQRDPRFLRGRKLDDESGDE